MMPSELPRNTTLLSVPVEFHRTEPPKYQFPREALSDTTDEMGLVIGSDGHFVGSDVLEAVDKLIQQGKARILRPRREFDRKKDYWLRVDTDEGRVWIPLPLKPVFKAGDHVHYYTGDTPTPPYWFGVIQEVYETAGAAKVEWSARPSPPLVDRPPLISLRWVNPQPEPA